MSKSSSRSVLKNGASLEVFRTRQEYPLKHLIDGEFSVCFSIIEPGYAYVSVEYTAPATGKNMNRRFTSNAKDLLKHVFAEPGSLLKKFRYKDDKELMYKILENTQTIRKELKELKASPYEAFEELPTDPVTIKDSFIKSSLKITL